MAALMSSYGKKKIRIMAFGTFDGVHKGHLDFFRQAKEMAQDSYLIISIARDRNVLRIKGKLPVFTERQRMALVRESPHVDKVVLSGMRDHIPHILRERPGIIALGYDQKEYVRNLKQELLVRRLAPKIKRLKPFKKEIYKNRLLKMKE